MKWNQPEETKGGVWYKSFCWLPTPTMDGKWIWLEDAYCTLVCNLRGQSWWQYWEKPHDLCGPKSDKPRPTMR